MSTTEFSLALLDWFESHGRKDLPWQQNPTPYRVWVSEIMLQQTQVKTVIPYYEQFMATFPDARALAEAAEDEVLHLWTGLGYYARARNLHKAAKLLIETYQGGFPSTIEAVTQLPGIGQSTAGAILSFSRQQRHAILDGNVKRVLSRYEGVEGWPGKAQVTQQLWQLAEKHTPEEKADRYNQAIMDLGATLCTRSKPRCKDCPVQSHCYAFKNDKVTELPAKKPKKEKPIKEGWMLVLECPKGFWLYKRPSSGLWGGLWSLPEFESKETLDKSLALHDLGKDTLQPLAPFRHTFTHFHLDIRPMRIQLQKAPDGLSLQNGEWHQPLKKNSQIGLSAPVKKLLGQLT